MERSLQMPRSKRTGKLDKETVVGALGERRGMKHQTLREPAAHLHIRNTEGVDTSFLVIRLDGEIPDW